MPDHRENESLFLGGRVRKRSLPVLPGPPPAGAPPLKRLKLAQGELAHVYDGEEGVRYIAIVELRPGTIRGNHFHHRKEESVYVIRGELLLAVQDPGSSLPPETLNLKAGDLAFIPAGIAHAYRTTEAGEAVEFSPVRFDASDVQGFRVLPPGG